MKKWEFWYQFLLTAKLLVTKFMILTKQKKKMHLFGIQQIIQPTSTSSSPTTTSSQVGATTTGGKRDVVASTTADSAASIAAQEAISLGIQNVDGKISDLNSIIAGDIPDEQKKALQSVVDSMQNLRSQLDTTQVNAAGVQAQSEETKKKLAQLEQEAIELCLWQRIGAGLLERVLGGQHEKRGWQRIGGAGIAHGALRHGL